jgi:L-rhamnose mutarotase
MKTTIFLVALFLGAQLFSQTTPTPPTPMFFIVETMKSKPGKSAEYVKAEMEVWKRLHQERKKMGLIGAWYFYAVRYPAGTNTAYDYVTVTRVEGMKKVENPWGNMLSGDAAKLLTKEQFAVANNTEQLRDLTTHALYFGSDFVSADPKNTTPAKYHMVNFMKVKEGMEEEYYNMETKIVKPMHVEMMKAGGGRAAWGLYSRVAPGGDGQPFDFVTTDFYNKWEDISGGNGDFRKTLEKVHPNMSPEFYSKRITECRHLVNQELWELLDYVQ